MFNKWINGKMHGPQSLKTSFWDQAKLFSVCSWASYITSLNQRDYNDVRFREVSKGLNELFMWKHFVFFNKTYQTLFKIYKIYLSVDMFNFILRGEDFKVNISHQPG